ncbi:dienelactone hydrolase family protein [Thalassospira sp. MA62]|nr:dienelactone hydrolase family protein [Thalassospira sp. MA62]
MLTPITATDGHTLDCWIEPAEGTRRGGIVIIQEIFGVTDQLKNLARTYAALGYEVAIPALFDRQEKNAVIPFDDAQRGLDLMLSAKLDHNMLDIEAAVTALAKNGGKVGVMGFCWGGGLALRAAQILDIAASVGFYGTRLDAFLDRPLKAPFLGHFGLSDDHTPAELLDAVKAYLPDVEIHMYEAGHAFANEARSSYVPAAAEVAHARTKEFFAQHIG